jgi:glycosyltransferase involved in cell wall biosynthesis
MADSRYRPIVLIGPYPGYGGDIGGISIHLKRARAMLLDAGFEVRVYQLAGRGCPEEGIRTAPGHLRPVMCQLFQESDALVHAHLISVYQRVLEGWLNPLRRGPLMLSFHGRSLGQQYEKSWLQRSLLRSGLRLHDHLIGVGPQVTEYIRKLVPDEKKVSTIPAFIPPIPNQADRDRIPAELWEFARTHKPLLAINGAMVLLDGKDLYGFDLAYELLRRMKRRHPDIGLILCLTNRSDAAPGVQAAVEGGAQSPELKGHVWINEPGYELWPVLEVADVFLRPSRSDGWALSVAEAVTFGTATVGSDVAERMTGTYVFPNEDVDAFERQTERALAEGMPEGAGQEVDYHVRLLDLYRELAKR